jgi:hypothetical protein
MKKRIVATVVLVSALTFLYGQTSMAQSQTTVSPTFFGASTASQNTLTTPYNVWWPNSSSSASPPISVGADGKGAATTWFDIENNPSQLSIHGSGTNHALYYWTMPATDESWGLLNAFISAAQGSGVDVMWTAFHEPQWATCYDYGSSLGGPQYGGQSVSGIYKNVNALSCTSPVNEADVGGVTTNLCPMGTSNGTGWCVGPDYNTTFQNLTSFATQLVQNTEVSGVPAIKYYEIWNEPDAIGRPYWRNLGTGLAIDYPALITQTYYFENAVKAAFPSGNTNYVFVGPGFSALDEDGALNSMCGTTCSEDGTGALYGFLNQPVTIGSVSYTGASFISAATYHLYPAYDTLESAPTATCDYATPPTGMASITTVECAGANLVNAVETRLYAFNAYGYANGSTNATSLTQAFMTEGSWMHNCNFASADNPDCEQTGSNNVISSALSEDMRAYVARYALLLASTTETTIPKSTSRQYWFTFDGGLQNSWDFGTMCDDGSDDGGTGTARGYPCYTDVLPPGDAQYYGGFAYGQVIKWLAASGGGSAGSIGACSGSDGLGNIWTCPVTEPTSGRAAVAVWVWDNSSQSYTVPSGYTDYLDLSNGCYNVPESGIITVTEEPILVEHGATCP